MTAKFSCGIDFGTSNSVCAITDGTSVSAVPLEGAHSTIPSALFFQDRGGILFGRAAIQAYIEGEEGRLLRGLKSVLGTSLMQEKTMIGTRAIAFTDILSRFLAHLKNKMETHTGTEISSVIMGRPVHFHDQNDEADDQSEQTLRNIAESIGFTDVQFQREPIAAAYAHEQALESEQLALVIDLGGGTSDFTIMRLSAARHKNVDRQGDILATGGVRVGGTNFDKRLSLMSFMPQLGYGSTYRDMFDKSKILPMPAHLYHDLSDWPKVHHAQTKKMITQTKEIMSYAEHPQHLRDLLFIQENALGHSLLQSIEQAKIDLTESPQTIAEFDEMTTAFTSAITRADFEQSIAIDIERVHDTLLACLADAGVSAQDMGLVILTGGSSQLPVIQNMVSRLFPSAILSDENKFASVGLGLGYQAQMLF